MGRGRRVVQDDEDVAVRDEGTEQAGLAIKVIRNDVRCRTECEKEAVQDLVRRDRSSGAVTPKVGIELAIGKARSDPVSPMQGQCRFSYPGRTHDGVDQGSGKITGVMIVKVFVECPEFRRTVDEAVYVAGQLSRHDLMRKNGVGTMEMDTAVDVPGLDRLA